MLQEKKDLFSSLAHEETVWMATTWSICTQYETSKHQYETSKHLRTTPMTPDFPDFFSRIGLTAKQTLNMRVSISYCFKRHGTLEEKTSSQL